MKRSITLIALSMFLATSVFSQKMLDEKKILLSKDQKKNEMEFALYNSKINGVTVFFESQRAPKVKGEKRTWQRYEMVLDKDMNVVSGDYKTLGTKNSIRPRLHFKDYRVAYTIWTDDEAEDSVFDKNGVYKKMKTVSKMVFQLIKYDMNNIVVDIKDYYLCDEKGFDNYRVMSYDGDLLVMAQYEQKRRTANPDEKNMDYIIYKRIAPADMSIKNEKTLNLLGKDELGLETFVAAKDKIYLVGKQLAQTKVGWKIPKSYMIFRLSMDGTEEARNDIKVPLAESGIGSIYLYEDKGTLYMAGEYGDPKAIGTPPSYPSGSSTVKVSNPYDGMFIKKFNTDLKEIGTATFDYKEKILKSLKKGNPKFNPRKGQYNLQDFFVLEDGSFYITAEMFVKFWQTVVQKTTVGNTTTTTYYYYTHYDYMDALVFKFDKNGELAWLNQIDRDNYRRTYSGHLKATKPLEPGKLEVFLMKENKLAMFYNTPGRKYSGKRFGLSEVVVSPNGDMTDAFDYTSELQFGLLDGGLVQLEENLIMAVGTDKKGDNLWIKKFKW